MANPKGNPQNLTPFTKDYQPDPKRKGPKRSHLRSFIKEKDLGSRDIQIIAQNLLDLTREQLVKLAADPKKPILLTGAAKALLNDMKKGNIATIQWLADRGFGQAKQIIESTNMNASVADIPREERQKILAALMEKYNSERTDPGTGEEVQED